MLRVVAGGRLQAVDLVSVAADHPVGRGMACRFVVASAAVVPACLGDTVLDIGRVDIGPAGTDREASCPVAWDIAPQAVEASWVAASAGTDPDTEASPVVEVRLAEVRKPAGSEQRPPASLPLVQPVWVEVSEPAALVPEPRTQPALHPRVSRGVDRHWFPLPLPA